jgi:hypothetical protein
MRKSDDTGRNAMHTKPPTFEELDHRENDGIQVSLLWNRGDNSLSVVVVDSRTNEEFELPAGPEKALDVFHHPFAYGASRGVAAIERQAEQKVLAG